MKTNPTHFTRVPSTQSWQSNSGKYIVDYFLVPRIEALCQQISSLGTDREEVWNSWIRWIRWIICTRSFQSLNTKSSQTTWLALLVNKRTAIWRGKYWEPLEPSEVVHRNRRQQHFCCDGIVLFERKKPAHLFLNWNFQWQVLATFSEVEIHHWICAEYEKTFFMMIT